MPPDESRFIGSSSGIFFVNTVHRAFIISKGGALFARIREGGARDHPSIDKCIVGPENPRNSEQDEITRAVTPTIQTSELISYRITQRGLGIAPSLNQAKELITVYF